MTKPGPVGGWIRIDHAGLATREDTPVVFTAFEGIQMNTDDQTMLMPVWAPSANRNSIVGRIVSIHDESISNDYGTKEYKRLVVDTGGYVAAVNCIGVNLTRWFHKHNTQVGQIIAIKYLGLQKAKNGRTFKAFDWTVELPDEASAA